MPQNELVTVYLCSRGIYHSEECMPVDIFADDPDVVKLEIYPHRGANPSLLRMRSTIPTKKGSRKGVRMRSHSKLLTLLHIFKLIRRLLK